MASAANGPREVLCRNTRLRRSSSPLVATFLGHTHPVRKRSVFEPVGDSWVVPHLGEEPLLPGERGGPGGVGGTGETVAPGRAEYFSRARAHGGGGHRMTSPMENSAHTAVPKSAQNGKGTTG